MMKHSILAISMILFCANLLGNNTYECFAKRGPKGYTTRDFEPFVLTATGRDNLSLVRKINLGGDEINMDEQFWNVKPVRCRIPLQGGRTFSSLGYSENSTNGYRVNPSIWAKKAPQKVEVAYVLDKKSNGKFCVPAIYECTKINN